MKRALLIMILGACAACGAPEAVEAQDAYVAELEAELAETRAELAEARVAVDEAYSDAVALSHYTQVHEDMLHRCSAYLERCETRDPNCARP